MGLGESDLRPVCVICRLLYSLVTAILKYNDVIFDIEEHDNVQSR